MNRNALEQSTEVHEGFSETPYKDTRGLWTIGNGRCLETNPLTPDEFRYLLGSKHLSISISKLGAKWLMNRSLDAAIAQLATLPFWNATPAAAQEVLVEMAYQMGFERVTGFRNMLLAISRKDYKDAARHGRDSDWWRDQTRARAEVLMKRLEAIPSAT